MKSVKIEDQHIFVITVLDSAVDPLTNETVVAAFTNQREAKKLWKELADEQDENSGICYFIEDTWLHRKATPPYPKSRTYR